MKEFEKLIIRERQVLINRSKLLFQRAIKAQYIEALKVIENHSIEQIKEHIGEVITKEPIESAFTRSYASAAEIAILWRNKLAPKKDATDDIYKRIFSDKLTQYARTKAGSRITNITGTTKDIIQSVVESATLQAVEEGLGVQATRDLIIQYIRDDYADFAGSRAQTIAQTEMITASNEATMRGSESTGFEFRKFWSTSGLASVRDSHRAAEQESIDKGGLMQDELFESCPGMSYPGDPAGAPEDIINCRCCLLTEIV